MSQKSSRSPAELELLKALYLMVMYVQGGDSHNEHLTPYLADEDEWDRKQPRKENFTGVSSWLNLDYGTLNLLQEEGWLGELEGGGSRHRGPTYAEVTKPGMTKARELLSKMRIAGFPGAREAILSRDYHEEWIAYRLQRRDGSWVDGEYKASD